MTQTLKRGECNFGNSKINVLPFKNIIVITKDETTAERYITTHPELAEDGNKVVARDWTKHPSGWWDLCTDEVDTTWFMSVTSYFTVEQNFKLPIAVDGGAGSTSNTFKPLIPFVEYDSPHCNSKCKSDIEKERRTKAKSTFNRYFGQEFAVFHKEIMQDYCTKGEENFLSSAIANNDDDVDGEPSVNGYFAFVEYADDVRRHRTRARRDSSCANGASDGDLCNLKVMKKACKRKDAVGDSVRMECPVSCDAC